jgi:hypothetical protein
MKKIFNTVIAMMMLLAFTACGGGGGGGGGESNNDPVVSTSITSGSVVATAKPTSTNSPDSPSINLVSYENVVSPGGSLTGRIDFNDDNGDVREIIIVEKGANKHNVITTNYSSGISDGYIDFDIGLSPSLNTGNEIEFDISLRDDNGNVGNYHALAIELSNDTKYSTTSYSGDSTPNISGDWHIEQTISESNPVMNIGDTYNFSVTIAQSGDNLGISNANGSHDATISGNGQFVTIAWTETANFLSQGYDIYVDYSMKMSGEITSSNTIEGEANSIIRRVYGADTHLGQVYPVSSYIVMTYSGSLSGGGSGDDHGDDISTATTVDKNSSTSGNLEVAGDEDFFKIVVSGGGTLSVMTTGNTDTCGSLYDAWGTLLMATCDFGDFSNFSMSRPVLSTAERTYYVRVFSNNITGNYSFVASFEENIASGDHGDDMSSATSINENSTTSGSIEEAGDNDFFKVVVSSRSVLSFSTTGDTDTSGFLLNSSSDLLKYDYDSGSGTNFSLSYLVDPGTYYIQVQGQYNTTVTGDYSLVSSFGEGTVEDDYGNSRLTTIHILSLSADFPDNTTPGNLEVGGDEDFFRIEVENDGTFSVYTRGNTDTYGYLLDTWGNILTENDDNGDGTNFSLSYPVSTGRYYVRVRGYNSSTVGNYVLETSLD